MTVKPTPLPRLFGIPAIATQLELSQKTIWRLIERGELQVHRLGRAVRVSEQDLCSYLGRCRR